MNTGTLNRQQRRSAIKAKRHAPPQRAIVLDAGMRLLHNARPYDDGEMVGEHEITRDCFMRLSTGSGSGPDFDRLSMILNCALIRAEAIDIKLVWSIQAAQDAMCRMKERYLAGSNFGFDAQGLEATRIALDDLEVIFDASSPLQMETAIRETYRRITDGQILNMNEVMA